MSNRASPIFALLATLAAALWVPAASADAPLRDPMQPYRGSGGAGGPGLAPAPRFSLTSVLISAERRVAVVNGKPYRQGARIDGAELVAIDKQSITLRDGNADLIVHLGNARPQLLWPLTGDEIAAVVKQQQSRLVEIVSRPGRRMQRRRERIAGIARRRHPALKIENGAQPQFAQQDLERGEAMIERAGRRFQPRADRGDRHSGRSMPGCDRTCGGEKVFLAELGVAHGSRIHVLDHDVNIS